jgi:hypothetical protein
MVVMTEEL